MLTQKIAIWESKIIYIDKYRVFPNYKIFEGEKFFAPTRLKRLVSFL